MASRNAVILGCAGLTVAFAAAAAWFLSGGGAPEGPRADPAAAPETAPAAPDRPDPRPAPPGEAPVPAAGDGSLRGRLVRGPARTPLAGTVRVPGEGAAPVEGTSDPDGRFLLDGIPRGRPLLLHAEAPGVQPAGIPIRIPSAGILDLGDVVLGGPLAVEVRVRDLSDRPVPGATVALTRVQAAVAANVDWVSRQFDARDPAAPGFTGITDDGGRATFDQVPPGSWFVRASAPGLADEGVSASFVEGVARDPVRLVLGPAFSLSGTVRHRDGRPAEGVLVRGLRGNAWWAPGLPDPTSRTAADGKYRLEGLARGPLSVAVETSPSVRIMAGSVSIPDVSTWDVRLGPRGAVRGRVLDDATGEPVPGVEVTAQVYPENGIGAQGSARTQSGTDGSYLLEGLPAGNLGALGARARGYLPYPPVEEGPSMANPRLGEGEVLEREIRLKKGAVLRGRVLDRAGKPVASATVRFKCFHPRLGVQEGFGVRADAEGNYRIEDAPRMKGLLKVEAPGAFQPDYPVQEWQILQQGTLPESCSVEVPAEGEAVKDLLVAAGGVVEGIVVDREGKPAAGVSVSAFSRTKPMGMASAGTSDGEGRFRIEGAAPAEDLVATASGAGGLRGNSDPFRLGEGETATGIRVTLKAAAILSGRVRREDGAAAPGAVLRLVSGKLDPNQVWNWSWQRQNAPAHPVGPDGSFRAEGLAPGTWTVVCQAEGAAISEGPVVTLGEGETKEGVEVVLPEERRVAGRVADPEGRPVGGASIRVRPSSLRNQWYGGPSGEPAAATTDADGRFAIRGLGKGSFLVTANAPGFGEGAQSIEAPKDDVVFQLVAGMTIEGVLVEEGTDAPVPGLLVWAHPRTPQEGMNQGRSATSGKDGAFVLKDLHPGAWNLSVTPNWDDAKSDWSTKSLQDVEAGTKDLRISLSKGLPIGGRVRDEAGKALAGFSVQVMGKDAGGNFETSRMRNGQVRQDGSFRIGGLPPGSYDLHFASTSAPAPGAAAPAPTVVRNIQAGTEDLAVVVRPGQVISGRVQDERGAAPGQAGNFQVTESDAPPGQGGVWGAFQPDGSFTTPPLDPSKTYDIVVQPLQGFMGGVLKGVVPGQKDAVVVVRKGGTISGRVVDEAGKAAGGVPVLAIHEDQARAGQPGGSAWGSTAANGEFTISGLGEGRFRLTAGGSGSAYRTSAPSAPTEVGAAGVTLAVAVGATMEGRLVDSRGGWGREQTWVMAAAEGAADGSGGYHPVKNDGTFTVKGLAPGRTRLKLWNAGKLTELGVFDAPSSGLSITVSD